MLALRIAVLAVLALAAGANFEPAAAAPGEGAPARIAGLRIRRATLNAGADNIGGLHILGEVLNASTKKVLFPVIEAKLMGADGTVFRTVSTYTSCIFHLRPGDTAPFDIQFFETRSIARYEISVKGTVSTREPMRGVSVFDAQFSILPSFSPLEGFMDVSGGIRNRSRFDYYFPEVCVAGLNAEGRFIIVGRVPTFTGQLPAGQINYFNGQVGSYPVPNAVAARFYVKVCTEDDVAEFGCNG